MRAFDSIYDWIYIFSRIENTIRRRYFDNNCLIITAYPCTICCCQVHERNEKSGPLLPTPYQGYIAEVPQSCITGHPVQQDCELGWFVSSKRKLYSAGPKSCYPPPSINLTFSELWCKQCQRQKLDFFCNKSHNTKRKQKKSKTQNYVQNGS